MLHSGGCLEIMVFLISGCAVTALITGESDENFMRCKWMVSARVPTACGGAVAVLGCALGSNQPGCGRSSGLAGTAGSCRSGVAARSTACCLHLLPPPCFLLY